jgi:hypothetical protein
MTGGYTCRRKARSLMLEDDEEAETADDATVTSVVTLPRLGLETLVFASSFNDADNDGDGSTAQTPLSSGIITTFDDSTGGTIDTPSASVMIALLLGADLCRLFSIPHLLPNRQTLINENNNTNRIENDKELNQRVLQ